MQPPCTPAVIRTSKPCSSGLSQRSASPKPASALPVAIASNNWSVVPPKLTKSTSRLCLALCDRPSDRAGPVRVPGEFELVGRALQLFAVRRGAANKRLARNIRQRSSPGCRQRASRSEDPKRRRGPEGADQGEHRAAGEGAPLRFG